MGNALCHWQLGMLRCVGAINKLMMQLHRRSVEPPCSEELMRCALELQARFWLDPTESKQPMLMLHLFTMIAVGVSSVLASRASSSLAAIQRQIRRWCSDNQMRAPAMTAPTSLSRLGDWLLEQTCTIDLAASVAVTQVERVSAEVWLPASSEDKPTVARSELPHAVMVLGVVHAGTNMLNSSGFEFGARLAVRVRHADGSHQLFGFGEAGMVQRGAAAVWDVQTRVELAGQQLMAKGSGSCTLQLSLVLLLEQPWLDLEEEPTNLMDAALTTPLPYHLRIDNTVVN